MLEEMTGKFRQNSTGECAAYMEEMRKPLSEDEFRHIHSYDPLKKPSLSDTLKKELVCSTQTITNFLPIVKWLPKYKIKEDLVNDLIAGVTVAIMHIPQGMAYALLGGVPPIVGIYMAFFPVWVYIIMGTSRHVSMGTFAVICMMVSKCVVTYSSVDSNVITYNATDVNQAVIQVDHSYSPIEVATAVCFMVGLWQVILGALKLGSLSVLLSETLVSGFTTGAAIHVLTSQVTNLLGIKVKKYTGPFKLIYTYIDIFKHIDRSNSIAIAISACCILLLIFFNEFIKPIMNKKFPKCNVPIPIELIIIVLGTLISNWLHLEEVYNVIVVGDVPTGFPVPTVPPLTLMPGLVVDCLVIAIVAVSINISMASIFSRKLNYEIDSNQEILASGFGNLFGSFFSCMPFAASLSRSLIQQTVGGKTQLASLISCVLLLFVLLFIGPFFESLPNCVLSSIIIVALKGMLFQMKDSIVYFKNSKLDGLVWIVCFCSVVCLDIDYGLGIGLIISVATMLIRAQSPEVIELGNIPNTNLYVDLHRYKCTTQVPDVLILKVIGGLHFANCEQTRKAIMLKYTEFLKHLPAIITNSSKPDKSVFLVLDFSSVGYMDPSAIKVLVSMFKDFKKNQCRMFICGCSDSLYESLEKCHFFDSFPMSDIYPFLPDIVFYLSHDLTC